MCSWCDKFIVVQTLNRQKKIYTIISVTHKVLKSCRSMVATLAHDVCDVHVASYLYVKTCPPTNKKFAHSSPPHQIFIPYHPKSIQPNKK